MSWDVRHEGPTKGRRRSFLSIAGHPLHALSVPVPIGLYVTAATTVGLWVLSGRSAFWHRVAVLSGASAAATASSVAVSGTIDYFTLVRHPRAARVGAAHMLLNSAALIFQVLAAWAGWDKRNLRGWRTIRFTALQGMATTLAALAGFAGGELVYRHRVGIFGADEEEGAHTVERDRAA